MTDLTRCEMAWCDVLHKSQTNVLNLMHMLAKPIPFGAEVPQFGHVVFSRRRRNFFNKSSAAFASSAILRSRLY